MRRYVPILIAVIGLFALVIDFWPHLSVPTLGNLNAGSQPIVTKLGLDLQGGFEIVYQAQPKGGKTPGQADMSTIQSIVENRVNSTGVAEPIVQVMNGTEIDVQLPGATNANQIRQLVGNPGLLQFVDLPAATYGTNGSPGPTPVPTDGETLPASVIDQHTILTGAELDASKLSAGYSQTDATWVVNFAFKSPADQTFANYTSANVNHFFAIVLDGKVQSAPYIKSAITGGQGQISGSFTAQSAQNLVTILQYGALPFPLKEISSQNIPATLGKSFLNTTLLAGGIGIGLVLLFMLIYYRLPGLVADGALIYYSLVVLAFFRIIPVTLTLAGIAGFVLSVGMAVDANILIFERTKEELRVGKTLAAGVEAGFNRAWNSILDSNVSSLITASILYFFGTATIKGFALVLMIGVLTSMFTAVTVSRSMLRFVVQRPRLRRAWLFGVTDEEFQARQTTTRPARREARARV